MTNPKKRTRGDKWMKLRAKILQRDGHACTQCGSTDRLQVDHIQELRHGGTDSPTNLATLCHSCHVKKTNAHGNAKPRRGTPTPPFSGQPRNPRSPVPAFSAGVARLTGREPPGEPRFASEPHPDRAGTLVDKFAEWMSQHRGLTLYPWQRLVAERMLEFTAEGRWCWPVFLVFVPRQSGKTSVLGGLCEWRAMRGDAVAIGAYKLANTNAIMRPRAVAYRELDGYGVSLTRDAMQITWPDGGLWHGLAANGGFCRGFSYDLVVVDEVQAVPVEAYESAAPSQLARPNPQMVMVGTAPTVKDDGELFTQMRSAALAGSYRVGIMEWSAPQGSDWRDEEVWRAASPVWSPVRLDLVRLALETYGEDGFRPEYLCQSMAASAEPWLAPTAFDKLRDRGLERPDVPAVIAVNESRGGRGGVMAVAWLDGDVRCVTVSEYPSMDELWDYAPPSQTTLVGATLWQLPQAQERGAKLRGRRELSESLNDLRRLVQAGDLRWDGDLLGQQVRSVPVVEDAHGDLRLGSGGNTAALRTAAWAVRHLRSGGEPLLLG